MSAPKRIQLRRTRGWRKPEGAVVVARPSKWSNPYVVHAAEILLLPPMEGHPLMPRLPMVTVVDDTTIVINSSAFFEQFPGEHLALLDWCRLHGLDPQWMPATGQRIVRDVERCRVVYDAFVIDEDGTRKVNPGSGHMWLIERVHAQGETPPAPFPDVILAHLDPPRETA